MPRLVVCALLLLITSIANAALNKWVDEKGQVHYGDQIPPQYLDQKRSVLNEQGVVVERFDKAKTGEEHEKEVEQKRIKAEQDRARMIEAKKKALRDRVLMDTFTTERDLLIARDARVEAVDSQIQLTEAFIKENERKQEDVRKRIEGIEKAGRTVPDNLLKEQDSVSKQMQTNVQYIADKKIEREEIVSKFEADIKRFRELMEEKNKRAN